MSFFCYECNCITETIKPVFLKKIGGKSYYIAAICKKCENEKSRFLNMKLPNIFTKLATKIYINNIKINGEKVDILEELRELVLH
jgi:hypothetical protein